MRTTLPPSEATWAMSAGVSQEVLQVCCNCCICDEPNRCDSTDHRVTSSWICGKFDGEERFNADIQGSISNAPPRVTPRNTTVFPLLSTIFVPDVLNHGRAASGTENNPTMTTHARMNLRFMLQRIVVLLVLLVSFA